MPFEFADAIQRNKEAIEPNLMQCRGKIFSNGSLYFSDKAQRKMKLFVILPAHPG